MKGKVGLVVGLAAGYVLGSRAGRDRYDQIKQQWLKVYESEPVKKQVDRVKDLSKDAASALPSTLWSGAVKATKAATGKTATGKTDTGKTDTGKADAGKTDAGKTDQSRKVDVAPAAGTTSSDTPTSPDPTVWHSGPTVTNEVGDAAEDSFADIQKAARDHDGV